MTTTQPPLQPGDRVLVECVAVEPIPGEIWLRPVRTDERQAVTTFRVGIVRWHPMPGPTSPDPDAAAHVAELERTLAAYRTTQELLTAELATAQAVARGNRDHAWAAVRECERMRPVVALAEAWADADGAEDEYTTIAASDNLMAGVDAFRAGQKAPASPTGSTLSHERPEDAPSDRLTSEEAHRAFDGVDELNAFIDEQMADPEFATAFRAAEERHRKPADARPQPTDAGRRDWARQIAVAVQAHRLDLDFTCSCGWEPPADLMEHDLLDVSNAHVFEAVVAALRLHELEDERDEYREAQQRALRDREAVEAEMDRRLTEAWAERDAARRNANAHSQIADAHAKASIEAAGKLDALRAGVALGELRGVLGEIVAGWKGDWLSTTKVIARLEAALAGDTSATDGTTTAETRCGYSDRDLSTNRRIECHLPTGHDNGHRFRFVTDATGEVHSGQ